KILLKKIFLWDSNSLSLLLNMERKQINFQDKKNYFSAEREICQGHSWMDAFKDYDEDFHSEEETSLDPDDPGYYSDENEKFYMRLLDYDLAEEQLDRFDKL